MKQYFQCEIMTEVAWQLVVDIALDIIRGKLLTDDAEDIDEWIANYLHEKGYTTK